MEVTRQRAIRGQSLPEHEVTRLNELFDQDLYARIHALFHAGWSLTMIGNAFNPPRGRSTVRYWLRRYRPGEQLASLSESLPRPRLKSRGYVSRRPVSPGIPRDVLTEIEHLSPLARRYRSRMSPFTEQAIANERLTEICVQLHSHNVTVKELAEAADVTYRAMARRLGK